VLERAAGGGAVLLDEHMLCCAICLPIEHPLVSSDLTESYRWLGDHFAARLRTLGIPSRRVEVAEARADVADLHASAEPVSALLLTTCYGALSPHEVITETRAKVAGFAQVRRRHAALFQVGILLQDQSRLADFVNVSDEPTREAFRSALERRTAGLEGRVGDLEEALLLLQTDQLL
jgi:lipoate-protein ligase A